MLAWCDIHFRVAPRKEPKINVKQLDVTVPHVAQEIQTTLVVLTSGVCNKETY